MKKILIFGYTLEMGGAEKALVDTINYLSKNGYEIDLYLIEKKGSLIDSIPSNVNIYQIKRNLFSYILFRYIAFFRQRIINRIANKKDYNYAVAYMEGRAATWISDIKKSITRYAWIHSDVNHFDIGIKRREICKSYSKVDKVICVSEVAKDNFCNKYNIDESKVDVIYNYINEEEILKKSKDIIVNNKNVITFVNVAKMRDEKRQDRLVYAANYLKQKGYMFKIQLIGDGPNFEKIKSLVESLELKNEVELLGLIENPYPYIKNANYFILTSEHEGYGIVLKEALALKKKIIATDTIGANEILMRGKYGKIIPNNDMAVKEIIEEILDTDSVLDYLNESIINYKGDNDIIKKKTLQLFGDD